MQRKVDDLLHAALLELLALVRLCLAQLHVAERDQVADIRLAVRCGFEGLSTACGAGGAFEVDGAVERGGCGPGGVTEVLVQGAEGVGGGEVGVRDTVAGELVDAFEKLLGR
jgi:hypothetical protein